MVKKYLLEEEEKEGKPLRFNLMKSKIVCLSKNNEFKEILRGKKNLISILQFFLKNYQIKIKTN